MRRPGYLTFGGYWFSNIEDEELDIDALLRYIPKLSEDEEETLLAEESERTIEERL